MRVLIQMLNLLRFMVLQQVVYTLLESTLLTSMEIHCQVSTFRFMHVDYLDILMPLVMFGQLNQT